MATVPSRMDLLRFLVVCSRTGSWPQVTAPTSTHRKGRVYPASSRTSPTTHPPGDHLRRHIRRPALVPGARRVRNRGHRHRVS